jgi:multiple sugar transport system permease protein
MKNIHNRIARENKGYLFILPSFLGVIVFYVIPYLDVIRRAFTNVLSGKFVGLDNFKLVLQNEAFRLAAWNTVRMMAVCIPLLVVLSLLIAVILQNHFKKNIWIKSGLLIPMAIPTAAVVLLWKILFDEQGFLNGFLQLLGINGPDWMNTGNAFGVLVFSCIWKNLGYSVILWTAALDSIPKEIYEAAKTDGAGETACFFWITLPNLFSAFFTIVVLSLINSFKVYREAYLIAGDYPHESIYMLQHLFNNWYRNLDLDKMASGAVLNGAALFILVLFLWRLWGNKERDV